VVFGFPVIGILEGATMKGVTDRVNRAA
jgi:hypothetical protein